MPDRSPHGSALSAMALLATLRTAADVHRGMAERRAGRDPSAQQPPSDAHAALQSLVPALKDTLLRLRLALALPATDDERAGLVRAFETRMAAGALARDLHRAHQHLLSLYPAVPEDLVESVRLHQAAAARLLGLEGPGYAKLLRRTVDRTTDALADLEAALKGL